MKHKFLKEQSLKEEDDSLIVEDLSSDEEWIVNSNDEDDNSVPIEVGETIEDEGKSIQVDLENKVDSDYEYDTGAMQFDHVSRNFGL